ncbi:MAG: S-layer homology domain-containing protein [Oscillospiraceae bacterium]|nr:S-layer homology domain-containing protein [Oscillospiraceae bacterium]
MNNKRLISFSLALVLLCGSVTAAAAGTAGSASDPLISKSYVDNTYTGLVLTTPLNTLSDAMAVLQYKLAIAGKAKASGVSYSSVMPGGVVSLGAGSGFVLTNGSAKLTACSGTFIDLSEGTVVSAGQNLSSGHRYIAAESTTATVSAVTTAKLALFGSVTVNSGTAPAFGDVTEDKWFYTYVCYAVQKGLVSGRSQTVYDPDANLSIAEAIKLAACMNQLYNDGSVTLANDPSLWYKSYLDYATGKGIVTKTYGNYDAAISRSEFVAIFYASLPISEYTQKNSISDNAIPDVTLTSANASPIYSFYRAGILIGSDSSGTFYPDNSIKRSEVAAVLTRMFEKDSRQSITLK